MTSVEVKTAAYDLGADLCGIAPVDRFAGAPKGFRPDDIWQDCRSMLVFAKKLNTLVMPGLLTAVTTLRKAMVEIKPLTSMESSAIKYQTVGFRRRP